jgi:hypothetical protein
MKITKDAKNRKSIFLTFVPFVSFVVNTPPH